MSPTQWDDPALPDDVIAELRRIFDAEWVDEEIAIEQADHDKQERLDAA